MTACNQFRLQGILSPRIETRIRIRRKLQRASRQKKETETTMSIFATAGVVIAAALPLVTNPVGEPFEPKILDQRDNGFLVEIVVSCPAHTPGIMHYDKVVNVFTDSKQKMHDTVTSAYASTCGINKSFLALK
jgi:hypothetical protein